MGKNTDIGGSGRIYGGRSPPAKVESIIANKKDVEEESSSRGFSLFGIIQTFVFLALFVWVGSIIFSTIASTISETNQTNSNSAILNATSYSLSSIGSAFSPVIIILVMGLVLFVLWKVVTI